MTLSRIVRDIALVAATGATGACSTAQPDSAPGERGAGSAATARSPACSALPGFAFNGPCASFTLTRAGGTARVPADRGYSFSYVFPPNALESSVPLAFGTAVRAQIGKDQNATSFPAFTRVGLPIMYAVGYASRNVKPFTVDGDAKLELSSTNGFPNGACALWVLDGQVWKHFPGRAKLDGNTLTVTLASAKTGIEKGKSYLAFACK